jgi:hypothetical protein
VAVLVWVKLGLGPNVEVCVIVNVGDEVLV